MVRRMLIAVAIVAMMAAGASKAWAQLPAGYSWSLKAGWNGSVTSSSHQDEGVFSGVRGFYDFRNGFFGAGGEVRFGHEMDFGGVQKYLGVFQYSDSKTFKWPCYVNLYMGLEHFSDGSNFYMEPAAGLIFPWGFKDYKLYGQIGIPIHFFDGNTEAGFGGQVGLTLPFLKK